MVSQPYDVTNLTSEDFASEQYQAINLHNFEQLEQIQALPDDVVYNINVVGRVLPFKSNRLCVIP